MSQRVSPWIYPVWYCLRFLDLSGYFLSHVRKVFDYNLFKYFLRPFLFIFSFRDPYNLKVGAFNVVSEVSETVLISFPFTFKLIINIYVPFLYSAPQQLFPPFCLPAHLFVLLSQLFCCWFFLVYFSFQLLCCS